MPATSRIRFVAAVAAILFTVAAGAATYTVEKGDTLSQIADEHNVSAAALAEANGITNPNRILVGQQLVIPGIDAAQGQGVNPGGIHIVRFGETLDVIASRYGLSVAELSAANGITNPNVIYTGTRLQLDGTAELFLPTASGTGAHVVTTGDTLGRIAAKYGTTITALAEANGISNPNLILVGSSLMVPGGWVCPVPGGSFFNDYGFPRGSSRFHDGTDIFAPRGTSVLAPVSGTVEQVVGTIGGNQFVLYGDDGHTYVGTHMDAFGASGWVPAGTPIGTVGDSGNAVGSRTHLHFEIHPDDGGPTNPYPALAASCR